MPGVQPESAPLETPAQQPGSGSPVLIRIAHLTSFCMYRTSIGSLLLGCLTTSILLCGCAAERTDASAEQMTPVAVLWRTPPPRLLPSAAAMEHHAEVAGVRPNAQASTMIAWSISRRAVRSLLDLQRLAPELFASQGGALLREDRVSALLAGFPETGVSLQTPGLVTAPDQIGMCRCTNVFGYALPIRLRAGRPDQDELVLRLAKLQVGMALALHGHIDQGNVVLDALCARSLVLESCPTYVGTYPSMGLIQSFPWIEPQCLASEADRTNDPVTMPAGYVLVIPERYWIERPLPHIRQLALSISGPAPEQAEAVPSLHQGLLIISAAIVPSAPGPAPDMHHADGAAQEQLMEEPVRLLTPPWRRESGTTDVSAAPGEAAPAMDLLTQARSVDAGDRTRTAPMR